MTRRRKNPWPAVTALAESAVTGTGVGMGLVLGNSVMAGLLRRGDKARQKNPTDPIGPNRRVVYVLRLADVPGGTTAWHWQIYGETLREWREGIGRPSPAGGPYRTLASAMTAAREAKAAWEQSQGVKLSWYIARMPRSPSGNPYDRHGNYALAGSGITTVGVGRNAEGRTGDDPKRRNQVAYPSPYALGYYEGKWHAPQIYGEYGVMGSRSGSGGPWKVRFIKREASRVAREDHPSVQGAGYAEYLQGFIEGFRAWERGFLAQERQGNPYAPASWYRHEIAEALSAGDIDAAKDLGEQLGTVERGARRFRIGDRGSNPRRVDPDWYDDEARKAARPFQGQERVRMYIDDKYGRPIYPPGGYLGDPEGAVREAKRAFPGAFVKLTGGHEAPGDPYIVIRLPKALRLRKPFENPLVGRALWFAFAIFDSRTGDRYREFGPFPTRKQATDSLRDVVRKRHGYISGGVVSQDVHKPRNPDAVASPQTAAGVAHTSGFRRGQYVCPTCGLWVHQANRWSHETGHRFSDTFDREVQEDRQRLSGALRGRLPRNPSFSDTIEVNGTRFSKAELANLYHLARAPLGSHASRYERLVWAAATHAREHPEVPRVRAYKALTRSLGFEANPYDTDQYRHEDLASWTTIKRLHPGAVIRSTRPGDHVLRVAYWGRPRGGQHPNYATVAVLHPLQERNPATCPQVLGVAR